MRRFRPAGRSDVALVALAGCALAACAPAVDDIPLAGPYTVKDGALVDGNGGQILLRGVNLSQTAKSAPYAPVEMDGDGLASLDDAGPLAVRYVVTWAAIEPEDGVVDESFLADLTARTRRLAGAGHLVLLDLHQDLFGEGFGGDGAPRFACSEQAYASFTYSDPWFSNYTKPEVEGCFDALFDDDDALRHMAASLRLAVDAAQAGAGAHLVGVDLINEPHPGSKAPAAFDERLARYYQLAAEALDGTGVALFFEPDVMHNLGEPTHLAAAPAPSSVYAPHLYPFDAELGHYDDPGSLASTIERDVDEAKGLGVPLVVGEYAPLLTDPGARAYVDDVLALLDDAQAGAFYWDWSASSDRGLLHDGADAVAVRALRPYPLRTAGRIEQTAFDPSTRTLTLVVDETGARGATAIVWPRAWGTPEVTVSDGSFTVDGTVVTVRHDPSKQRHTVTVVAR